MKNILDKKVKDMKAITLIALVITIIILLILAGITITQLSNSGLFGKSQEAKERSENAIAKEETELAKYDNEINSYISGNRDYTPISYSADEQDTGLKYIDGKTIYQKSFNITCTDGLKGTIENLDTVVDYSANIVYRNATTRYQYTLPVSHPSYYGFVEILDNNFYIRSKGLDNYSGILTILYTKTTN